MSDSKETPLMILTELLIIKYGKETIKKLLTGEMCPEINKESLRGRKAYIRDLKDEKTPFTDVDGHEIGADLVLRALEDAGNLMNYSNWHNDKFHRAGEAVIRFCEQHNIPIKFRARV